MGSVIEESSLRDDLEVIREDLHELWDHGFSESPLPSETALDRIEAASTRLQRERDEAYRTIATVRGELREARDRARTLYTEKQALEREEAEWEA